MAEYDINSTAAAEAAALLRDLLQAEIPNGDFTEGSAISDLLIDGHAVIAGYLKNQIQVIRNRQSLLTLQNLPETESVSDAADAILDNFFRTRAQGQFAKGVATLHFSQRQDVLIPRTARFFKTTALVFYIDSSTDILIPASDLRPEVGANGVISSYSTTIFLTAARVGSDYNISPGRFVSFDRFNALLLYVENINAFSNGTGVQTTADFINRSTNAIALRALINARSNDATLLQNYQDVESTVTVGYGDGEMVRDKVSNVSNGVQMHVGGHMDLYVRMPVQEVVERLVIEQLDIRNDNRIVLLRDAIHSTTPGNVDFLNSAVNVQVGDILNVTEGIPEAPIQFRIVAVRANEVEVSPATPFSTASDEVPGGLPIGYSIGNNYPTFDNKVPAPTVGAVTTVTSRQFAEFNRVQLPGRPTYRIKKVELLPPIPAALQGFADLVTGNVDFTARKNSPTLARPASAAQLSHYVEIKNPGESQSARAVAMLEVGWPAIDLSGLTLEITYETLTNFATIDSYVSDRLNRPACSNTLTRAPHPVYIYASIPYRARTTPVSPLSTVVPVFDVAAATANLITFINNYRETEPLDVSLLATKARETSNAVASIYNFALQYQLFLPDGRVMTFETSDKITIFPDGATSTAALLNPVEFGLPATGYYTALRQLLANQGVSDRVTRYRAVDSGVVFEQRT
jgi:hypothetical protein